MLIGDGVTIGWNGRVAAEREARDSFKVDTTEV